LRPSRDARGQKPPPFVRRSATPPSAGIPHTSVASPTCEPAPWRACAGPSAAPPRPIEPRYAVPAGPGDARHRRPGGGNLPFDSLFRGASRARVSVAVGGSAIWNELFGDEIRRGGGAVLDLSLPEPPGSFREYEARLEAKA
jgi:hypothetical protein